MYHVVMYSGGVASWAEGKLTAQRYGPENVTLLFQDTKMEDADLYRFLDESAANIGATLIKLKDGRDIWQVFKDKRFLGNSRQANCSSELKAKVSDAWLKEHTTPETHVLHFGFSWEEPARIERVRERLAPYRVETLLADAQMVHADVFDWLAREGIARPRLYDYGFTHNNCGGGCVRAGKKHWAHLLQVMPERYAEWEAKEQEIREYLDKDVSMLGDITLRDLRRRLQQQPNLFDAEEIQQSIGRCGCYLADAA